MLNDVNPDFPYSKSGGKMKIVGNQLQPTPESSDSQVQVPCYDHCPD